MESDSWNDDVHVEVFTDYSISFKPAPTHFQVYIHFAIPVSLI